MIDDDDELERFMEGVEAALTRQFGPDHQAILGGGEVVAEFDWGDPMGTEAW
ncbi:MAG: hypothetical protein Q8K11_01995 [Phenylobacterium sp.]|uniref:hypothetical protein n=1 Tax=Phenylobacterium sp. TaxID=1871053 RepID=UPI002731BE35|nr:hypothetical protein [Phenylobacterium sp.]MDP2008925.1 hypothetical protein [Phenylobacterium sp.]